jgi:hypothetical protein
MGRASTLRQVLKELRDFVTIDAMNDICDDHGLPRRKSFDDVIDQLCVELDGDLSRLVSAKTKSMSRDAWNDFLEVKLELPRRRSYDDLVDELEMHFGGNRDPNGISTLNSREQTPAPAPRDLAPGELPTQASTMRQVLEELRHFVTIDVMNDMAGDHSLPRRRRFEDAIDDLCTTLEGDLARLVSSETPSFTRNDWNDFLEERFRR